MIPRIRPTSPAAAVIVKSNSKRSELYEAPNGRESITSSLTGFGTNSSLAGLGGLGNKESGKGYRVGTTEEFVFPGGIPRDRLDLERLCGQRCVSELDNPNDFSNQVYFQTES